MPKKGNAKLLFTQLIEQGCGASSPDRNKKGEIFMLNAVIFILIFLAIAIFIWFISSKSLHKIN
jgi:hypothetical protein